jgi:hypothetical protein
MRDFDRISRIMALLQELWSTVPDWRFGQLVENLKGYLEMNDLYYLEDDIFEKKLEELIKDARES